MGRDQRPRPFPLGLLQPPRGTGNPGQDPPLPPARLDPLAARHPPIVPAAFRKLDAVAVLTGRLLPAPLIGGVLMFRERLIPPQIGGTALILADLILPGLGS